MEIRMRHDNVCLPSNPTILRRPKKTNREYSKKRRRVCEPGVLRPVKFIKVTNRYSFGTLVYDGCGCDWDCFGAERKVETEAKQQLTYCRHRNTTLKEWELTEWIAEIIRQLNPQPDRKLQYRVGSQVVCKYAFLEVYGISSWKLKACRALAQSGKSRIVHGSDGCVDENGKKSWLESWLQKWLKANSDRLVTGYCVVPSFIQQSDVHKQIVKDWCTEHLGLVRNLDLKTDCPPLSTSTCCAAQTSPCLSLPSGIVSSVSFPVPVSLPPVSVPCPLIGSSSSSLSSRASLPASGSIVPDDVWSNPAIPPSLRPPSINILRPLWKKCKILFPKKGDDLVVGI